MILDHPNKEGMRLKKYVLTGWSRSGLENTFEVFLVPFLV